MATYSVNNIKIDNGLFFTPGPTAGYVLSIDSGGSTTWISPQSGSSGSAGTSGSSGSSGVNGTIGSNGLSGTSGTSGVSGSSGSSGSSGTSGANGGTGSSGTSGVNGGNGSSGTSGANGSSGTSGTSPSSSSISFESKSIYNDYGGYGITGTASGGNEYMWALGKPVGYTGLTYSAKTTGKAIVNFKFYLAAPNTTQLPVFTFYYGTGTSPLKSSVYSSGTFIDRSAIRVSQANTPAGLICLQGVIDISISTTYWFDISMKDSSTPPAFHGIYNGSFTIVELKSV